jgi:hypothetical protein
MTTLTFDTHEFVKKLKGVGLLQITIIAALMLRLAGKA